MTVTDIEHGNPRHELDREWETDEGFWKRIGRELGIGMDLATLNWIQGQPFPGDSDYTITSARLDTNQTRARNAAQLKKKVVIVTGIKYKTYT